LPHPTFDGKGVKAISSRLIYQSWFIYKQKENIGSQMGQTNTTFFNVDEMD